ncbi:MAG: cytochrome c biogenesis CcdA family protein [Candidatus Hydrothermarchaeaceae archaeon]
MSALTEPTVVLAFAAGIVTMATPCVIPILPPMLAGSVGHKLRPIFIVIGSITTFTLMGGALSAFGIAVGATKDVLRLIFVAVIIALGAVMADDDIYDVYARYSSALVNRLYTVFKGRLSGFQKQDRIMPASHPLGSAFLLGLSLGIVWIPCVGPILGSVLAYATIQGNVARGSLLLFAYGMGLGLSLLVIAYGGKYTGGKLEWAQRNSTKIKKIAGWVIILTGVAILFGLDRIVQTWTLSYFPELETKLLEITQG